jgi:hypothetical protein
VTLAVSRLLTLSFFSPHAVSTYFSLSVLLCVVVFILVTSTFRATMSTTTKSNPPRPRTLRRLSSEDATADLLSRGPAIVVPPHLVDQEANDIAASMELARQEIEAISPLEDSDTPRESTVTDRYAYAFDIDGVLIRGGRPIPEAVEAMKVLNGQNQYGIKM